MSAPTYERYQEVFRGIPMPFAFVDLELLDANVAAVVRRAGGKKIRVASKSIRCVEVMRRVFARDAVFQGVLCFTVPEALHLAREGFEDLVVAYPVWEGAHIEAAARIAGDGRPVTLMVDSVEHVEHIAHIARRVGVVVPLCIEADMSVHLPRLRFGVWRSPLIEPAQVAGLAAVIARTDGVRLDGLMGYEAQIAGLPDRPPGAGPRGPVIRALKKRSVGTVAERRARMVDVLRRAGHELRFVNGGGTGSMETTAAEPGVTEITAGSAFYSPALFDHYDSFRHLPAVAFAIQVVRRPSPGIYTCLGGGYVASGAVGPDKAPVPYLPEGATLLATEGAGEVQTPVRYVGPTRLDLGAPIFMRHAKAGELCERFDHLVSVSSDGLEDELVTYRGQGQAFL